MSDAHEPETVDLERIPLFDDEVPPSRTPYRDAWSRLAGAGEPTNTQPRFPHQPNTEMSLVDSPVTATAGRPREQALYGRSAMGQEVDWEQVRILRRLAGTQLTAATLDREGIDDGTRQELGRKIILELVGERAREADRAGLGEGYSPAELQRLASATFDSLFGLGRLQPLVDDEQIENIEIRGFDNVWLIYADGRIERGPAVADSDEELIDNLQFFAARSGGAERPFSPSNPNLDLKLPGDHRLAASAWITPKPYVVIRRHRLVDVDLDDLVQRDMLSPGLASFLRACVRGKKSIVVSGPQGAGKTTLVRALCNEIPPWESIGTIETEYELMLHEMTERHPRCYAFEARPGSGERHADGTRLGEVTLDEILRRMLRLNLSRIIVGEVRGLEVVPMFEAMMAGAGSLSTTHAYSARAAIQRLAGLALKGGSHLKEFALDQIAQHIDVIVQIRLEDTTTDHDDQRIGGGVRRRFISEVIVVDPGEDGHPAVTDVYVPGLGGKAQPGLLPSDLEQELRAYGFADAGFARGMS